MVAIQPMAAEDLYSRLPSNRGGWMNLSYGVTDSTYYTRDMLPLETQISGNTIHVLFMDWAKNASGEYPIYYRRSTDLGKTWDKAQLITTNKDSWDGSSIAGQNSRLMAVSGNTVHLLIPYQEWAKDFRVRYYRSTDGGSTFSQKVLLEGTSLPAFQTPHIVCDGNTVVAAFSLYRNNQVRVFTSTDGGNSFNDLTIEQTMQLKDLTVSGNSWIVLGTESLIGGAYVRQGTVWIARSTDGGKSVEVKNIAHVSGDGKTYSDVSTLNNPMYTYHPQMVQQGQVVDVMYRGSLSDGEPDPRYDYGHTIHQRSTDGGKTWSEPKYLPESTGERGTAGTGTIAAKGDNIYIYTTWDDKYRIYHSHDGGQTWAVQHRGGWAGWSGDSDGYNMRDSYMLYIAPDDPTGQHAYLTGKRFYYAETRDGFRTLSRNFMKGYEASDQNQCTNEALRVLVDDKGMEHWFVQYVAPHKSFSEYFYNICYRRNEPEPALGNTDMALDIAETPSSRPQHQLTIPMTESLMATSKATTVECWAKIDELGKTFQIASLTHTDGKTEGGRYSGGWYINIDSDYSNDHIVLVAGLTTDKSVDGVGKQIYERRYKIYQTGYWHHIALTYDDAVQENNLRLYVDGALAGTQTEHGDILMGSNPIVIGKSDTYDAEAKVLIDNFAVWSRALPQEEILKHIYAAPDGADKDCKLLLTFDGSMKDKSQYGNDAVPISFPQLKAHDGIRPPHPEFTMSKEMKGQKVYVNDVTKDGEGCWWILPYPGKMNDYKTSEKRHVEQDFSRDPGTYVYTLIAKGTGNCNAYAATSQTIIVGGLSKVFPEKAAPSDVVMLRIQGGYELTYSKQPRVALHSAAGDIEGQWMVDKDYKSSNVVSPDDLAPAAFDLRTAALGKYDVIVDTDTLYQAFELVAGDGYPDVWVEVTGRDKMLWGKYQIYSIDFSNKSNVAAYNTPFTLFVSDKDGKLDLTFDFPVECFDEDIPQAVVDLLKDGENGVVVDTEYGPMRGWVLNIPYIAPNGETHLTFRVRMNNDASPDIDMVYACGQPVGAWEEGLTFEEALRRAEPDEWDDQLNVHDRWDGDLAACLGDYFYGWFKDTAIGAVPGVNCVYARAKYEASKKETHDWAVANMMVNAIGTAIACVGTAVDVGTLGGSWILHTAIEAVWNGISNAVSVASCLAQSKKYRHLVAVKSYDPNEMIGPSGYDDQAHYIKPIHQMPYTVTFENKASATAPAHEVFVNDTLDASKYDLSTFSFTSFGWADTQVAVGGSKTKEFTRDVVYNVKGQDILVRVSGQFDEQTGVARWSFVSLKKNGDEIDDPDLGFLLPNNDNRDGEGFVSFVVEHKPNPANGSTVSNKATIIFDANDPIVTNTYVNTFDTDYPTSQIASTEQKDGKLFVTVSGTDATSGIGTYHLYAFKNGGEAELVAVITEGNQASFACEAGAKYGLCVIATDNVGWVEAKDIKAETEVTSINEALTDRSDKGEYIDLQGRRHKNPNGPGVYIQNKKKVYIMKMVDDDNQ